MAAQRHAGGSPRQSRVLPSEDPGEPLSYPAPVQDIGVKELPDEPKPQRFESPQLFRSPQLGSQTP